MAGEKKGERIATVLNNSIVNPRREEFWPAGWTKPHPSLKREPFACVEGVFVHEGEVWLLLSSGIDGHIAQRRATEWKVERRSAGE